jgi:hypothetical protein
MPRKRGPGPQDVEQGAPGFPVGRNEWTSVIVDIPRQGALGGEPSTAASLPLYFQIFTYSQLFMAFPPTGTFPRTQLGKDMGMSSLTCRRKAAHSHARGGIACYSKETGGPRRDSPVEEWPRGVVTSGRFWRPRRVRSVDYFPAAGRQIVHSCSSRRTGNQGRRTSPLNFAPQSSWFKQCVTTASSLTPDDRCHTARLR